MCLLYIYYVCTYIYIYTEIQDMRPIASLIISLHIQSPFTELLCVRSWGIKELTHSLMEEAL